MKALKDLSFRQSAADPYLLIHDKRKILLLVYVDNIPIAAPKIEDVIWFKDALSKIFKTKDLGEMKKILGVQVSRDRRNRTLRIDQSHYLQETL